MTPILLAGLVLAVAAVVVVLLPRTGPQAAVALGSQAVATALVGWAIAPTLLGGPALTGAWPLSWPVGVVVARVDALSAFFLSWSLPMTLLGTWYATAYLRPAIDGGRNGGPHYALLNVVAFSFVVVYAVQNALFFLLGWEVAAVAAWLLVIWDYRSQKIRFAGFNYLVSTHVGLLLLVAAFMSLRASTDSMDFAAFATFLAEPSRDRGTVFLLLCASFALKSAFFPAHSWLPRAHAAAPAHVSALMSGVIHKAGLFAFVRFAAMIREPDEWMGWSVLGFGALSALFGALYTTAQRDLKRLLGYSSTENVGIAAMGFGLALLGRSWHQPALVAAGVVGGLLHVFNHAWFKCLLFYAAGAVYRSTHTVDLERLGGLWKTAPWTGALFLVGGAAISGLPPFNGFTSEILIYSGLLSTRAPDPASNVALVGAAALLAFVGAVSALSVVRAFGVAFLGAPRDPTVHPRGEAPPAMLVPMVVHAAGVVLIGLAPAAAVALVTPIVPLFTASTAAPEVVATVLVPVAGASRALVALVLVAVAAGGWVGRGATTPVTWGCGYSAGTPRMAYTASSFGEPFLRVFANLLPHRERARLTDQVFPSADGRFETHVEDGVESRLYEMLGRAETLFVRAADTVPEEPRFAFAAGLVAILGLVAVSLFGVGA